MRLIAYTRVSTTEQGDSGLGLQAQERTISLYAETSGHEIVRVVTEIGSGGKMRPLLQDALASLQAGEAEGIVVAKLDRLSRSLLHFAELMETSRREGWMMVALDLGVDTSTAAGELMANVLATFAQFERRRIGERTKEGLAEARANGVRLGRPASVDPTIALVIRAKRELDPPWSYAQIADHLTLNGLEAPRGGVKWHPSTVRKIAVRED